MNKELTPRQHAGDALQLLYSLFEGIDLLKDTLTKTGRYTSMLQYLDSIKDQMKSMSDYMEEMEGYRVLEDYDKNCNDISTKKQTL